MEGRESLSLSDSPGTVAPTGIRPCGVQGADKGISWRGSSDSGWDVCLSNSTVDTGVNAAVTPLFDFECIWHESACMCGPRTAPTPLLRRYVCFGGKKAAIPLGFPFVIKARLSSEIQDRFLPRGRGGRITRLVSLWEEPAKGHTDQYEGQPINTL